MLDNFLPSNHILQRLITQTQKHKIAQRVGAKD